MLFNARAALPQANRDLLDAADFINEHGWSQGTYRRGDAACVLGAIIAVCGTVGEATAAARLVVDKVGSIGRWNDTVCTSKEQVVAKLEDIAWEPNAESRILAR